MNREILKYVIQKEIPDRGMFSAEILSHGALVHALSFPVKLGEIRDVVLGLQRLERYPRLLPAETWEVVSQEEDRIALESGTGRISYRITENALIVEGTSVPPIWFNLMGHGIVTILDHRLFIDGLGYAGDRGPVLFDEDNGILDREGRHPLDFREERILGETIRVGHPQLTAHHGYHSVYLLNMDRQTDRPAASLTDFYFGLTMEVRTTAQRLFVESGNEFSGRELGKGGCIYHVHGGIQIKPLAKEGQFIRTEYRFVTED